MVESPEMMEMQLRDECSIRERKEFDKYQDWLNHPFTKDIHVEGEVRFGVSKDRSLGDRGNDRLYAEYLVWWRITHGSLWREIYNQKIARIRGEYAGKIKAARREAEALALKSDGGGVPPESDGIFGVGPDYPSDD